MMMKTENVWESWTANKNIHITHFKCRFDLNFHCQWISRWVVQLFYNKYLHIFILSWLLRFAHLYWNAAPLRRLLLFSIIDCDRRSVFKGKFLTSLLNKKTRHCGSFSSHHNAYRLNRRKIQWFDLNIEQ